MKIENDFKEIGDLTKSIRKDLFRLVEMSQDIKMRKYEIDVAVKLIRHLDKYRSRAENFMFSKKIGDISIFYPGDENDK